MVLPFVDANSKQSLDILKAAVDRHIPCIVLLTHLDKFYESYAAHSAVSGDYIDDLDTASGIQRASARDSINGLFKRCTCRIRLGYPH